MCVSGIFVVECNSYRILIYFKICINVLLCLSCSFGYFRDLVNMMLYAVEREKRYPEVADHSTRDDIVSCKYGCLLFLFLWSTICLDH